MNLFLLFLIGYYVVVAVANAAFDYEELDYFTQAVDDEDKQIDIYGPRTVILSKLFPDGTLVGFFMNSMLNGGTEEFVLAKNVTDPYMVFKWRNTPHILLNEGNLTKMISSESDSRVLPFNKFEIAKFDFLENILYIYYNNIIVIYYFPDLKKLTSFYTGPITDFYINNNRFIYTDNCASFNKSVCENGKFKQLIFYNYKKVDDKIVIYPVIPILFIFVCVIYTTYVLVKINK